VEEETRVKWYIYVTYTYSYQGQKEREREREEKRVKWYIYVTYTYSYQGLTTGWRRLINIFKLQVIFRARATNCRALLRKMTYTDKPS